jgi:hypothetical protein
MLRIRKEQYEELGKVSLKRFEDSMVEHIREFFPKYYQIHKEPLIRNVILYAVDRAESYGLVTERDVCLYINLVFLLGSNFNTDPQLPWAAAILNDETITDSVTRIDRLHDKGMEYLAQVAGVENEYLGRALLKVREISVEDFAQTPTANAGDVAATQLQTIWRRKCQHMGETTLRRLIRDAIESAKGYNIASERGVVLYTDLMFLLGSGFDKDPQFPWAENVLNDKSVPDQSTTVNRLYKEAMAFMEKWLT